MRYITACLILGTLCGCYPKSRILNWHHSQVTRQDSTVTDHVKLFGFAFPADPPTSKDFWSLTEDGQQAYIEEVGKRITKPEELAGAIALPFRRSAGGALIDLSTFKKKVVFTVMHAPQKPADRISSLELRLALPEKSGYEFSTWDRIATQYSTVELGSVSYTGTNTFKLAPEITMAGDILGTTAGELSRVAALTEEAKLAKRFIDVNGSLSKSEAWLTLNGMPGRDLAGNVIAEITMKADSTASFTLFEFSNLFTPAGAANTASDVKQTEVWVRVPYVRNPVKASLRFNVCVRQVGRGARTIAEGDDHVTLCCAREMQMDPETITIIDGNEFDVKLYYLMHRSTGQFLGLTDNSLPGAVSPIALRSLDEALLFCRWLQAGGATNVKGVQLMWAGDAASIQYAAPDARSIYVDEQSLQPKFAGKFFMVE